MARHIRKDDTVMVTTGRDKGRTGKVLRVLTDRFDPKAERVVVEGINIHSKHIRRSEAHPQGGMTNIEMPIHISNVSPVDGNGKATRVRFKTADNGEKTRVAATSGEQLGPAIKKAK